MHRRLFRTRRIRAILNRGGAKNQPISAVSYDCVGMTIAMGPRKRMTKSGFAPLQFLSVIALFTAVLGSATDLAAQRADRPGLAISGYVIDAEINTATPRITAKTTVAFTAPDAADEVSFGF